MPMLMSFEYNALISTRGIEPFSEGYAWNFLPISSRLLF